MSFVIGEEKEAKLMNKEALEIEVLSKEIMEGVY